MHDVSALPLKKPALLSLLQTLELWQSNCISGIDCSSIASSLKLTITRHIHARVVEEEFLGILLKQAWSRGYVLVMRLDTLPGIPDDQLGQLDHLGANLSC